MTQKRCLSCNEEFDLEVFGLDSSSADGHRARCPACIQAGDEIRRNLFSRIPQRKAQEMAMVEFLRDHPEVYADIVRRNYQAFKPYLGRMQKRLGSRPNLFLSESA